MKLDDNDTMVVTDISKEFSKSPKQVETTEMPLNQGSTLLLFLLAALLFCACVMASTLAFVSSFRDKRTLVEKEQTEIKRNIYFF